MYDTWIKPNILHVKLQNVIDIGLAKKGCWNTCRMTGDANGYMETTNAIDGILSAVPYG